MPRPADITHPNRDAFPRGLPGPALRALATAGIVSMETLTAWRETDLAALHGMGPKGVRMLQEALATQGQALAPHSR
ncbi:MAG: RNA polymerase [Bacteroidetes bacterium]|nr:RNA polymerase [Bacteroidota bacterium]